MAELSDHSATADEIEHALGEAEGRLLGLIRQGADGVTALDDVISGLLPIITQIRSQYRALHEIFERRDLPFDVVERLQGLRQRALWLYRKCRLEHLFFMKLRLERSLRDALYRQIVETWQELSALDEAERKYRGLHEDSLEADLTGDPASPGPP
jgi:hypothetical protein